MNQSPALSVLGLNPPASADAGSQPLGVSVPTEATGTAGLQPFVQPNVMSPQMLEMHLNQFVNQHPQQVAQIRAVVEQAMASGELTPQELNMIVQLATIAAQNPQMYPYVRKFAIQQGIATEQDLPKEYDQGLVFVLLLAGRAAQANING